MALTEAQVLDVLVLLGLPASSGLASRYGTNTAQVEAADVREILAGLGAAQEAAVTSLLTQWQEVKADTDRIKAEGLDSDPARARSHFAELMEDTIGYRPTASRHSSPWPSLRLGRG